jgi:hypothetical protein
MFFLLCVWVLFSYTKAIGSVTGEVKGKAKNHESAMLTFFPYRHILCIGKETGYGFAAKTTQKSDPQ